MFVTLKKAHITHHVFFVVLINRVYQTYITHNVSQNEFIRNIINHEALILTSL